MIIHDFDISTEPIVSIESFYGKPKKIVEKCLIIFSKVIHDHLLSSYDCFRYWRGVNPYFFRKQLVK